MQDVIACEYPGKLPGFRIKMQENGSIRLVLLITSSPNLVKLSAQRLNSERGIPIMLSFGC